MSTPTLRRSAAAALAAALLLVPSAGGQAAEGPTPTTDGATQSWSVRPTPGDEDPLRSSFFFDAEPGETVEDSFRVRNLGDRALPLKVYATDARNTETGGLDLLPAAEKPEDVGAWITLDRSEVTVGPLDHVDIPFKLKVPKGAEPGDHTGGILTSFVAPGSDADGQSVTLDRRLGSRVALRVDGPLNPALTISGLHATYDGTPNPAGRGRMDVTYRVTNDGNVRLSATQTAKVRSVLGLAGRTAKLADAPEVLPGNSVTLTTTVPGIWPTVRARTAVTLQPVPTRPGDEFPELRAAVATDATWAVPWAFGALMLAAGGGTGGTILLRRRAAASRKRDIDAAVQERLREPDLTSP